jgi:hypothetical protein
MISQVRLADLESTPAIFQILLWSNIWRHIGRLPTDLTIQLPTPLHHTHQGSTLPKPCSLSQLGEQAHTNSQNYFGKKVCSCSPS